MLKKFFYISVLLLTFLGLTSCENPIDPSMGGSNAFKEGCVLLQLEDVPSATNCFIERRNLTTSSYMSIYVSDYETNRNRTVTDYFTNAGDDYSYTIVYQDRSGDNWKNLKRDEKTITSYMGVGELKLESYSKATYDSEKSILKFSREPLCSPSVEQFIANTPNCNKNISFSYKDKETNNWAFDSVVKKDRLEFNLPSLMDGWRERYFDKPLVLHDMNLSVNLENLNYSTGINHNIASQIIDEEIVVKDTRRPLTYSYSGEGTVIDIPQGMEYSIARITRYTINEYGNPYDYMYIRSNKKVNQITDYFVESGKEYCYQVELLDDRWDPIEKTKRCLIKAVAGVGELRYTSTPIERYDPTSGIMTFTSLPDFNSAIKDLIARPSTGEYKNEFSSTINYYKNDSGENRWVDCEIKEEIDLSAAVDNEKLYGQEIEFNDIRHEVQINDVNYWTNFKYDIADKTIVIPDTRFSLQLTQTNDGIKITLPSSKPSNADYLSIGRICVDHPTNDYMGERYIVVDDYQNVSEITDFFALKGVKYKYIAFYKQRREWGPHYIVKQSKPIEFTATKSKFTGFLDPSTTVTYDEGTGVMVITPTPDLTIPMDKADINICLRYKKEDQNNFFDCKIIDGQIDISSAIYREDTLEAPSYIKLDSLIVNGSINNNISYEQYIHKDDLVKIIPSLKKYERIDNIPDKREKPKTFVNDNGIAIKLGNVADAKRFVINRYDCSTNTVDYEIINGEYTPNAEIIDYFVKPNTEYRYSIYYGDSDFQIIKRTGFSDPLATPNALGELMFENNPNVTWDGQSFITFNTKMDFSQKISKLQSLNLVSEGFNDYFISLHYNKPENRGWVSCGVNNNTGKADWVYALSNDRDYVKYFGQELTFDSIGISFRIKDLQYRYDMSKEKVLDKVPNFPQKITVTDNRIPLEVKQHANGVEIVVPKKYLNDQNITQLSINKIGTYNGKEYCDMYYFSKNLRDSNTTKPTSIIDYFVQPGNEYKYILEARTKDESRYTTNVSSPIKANGGIGELILKDNISTTTFDKINKTTTINPAQTFVEQNNKLKELTGASSNIYLELTYLTDVKGWYAGCKDENHDGEFKFNFEPNSDNSVIHFEGVSVIAELNDGTRYNAFMRKNDPRLEGKVTNVEQTLNFN